MRVRMDETPVSSNTSTGFAKPLTGIGPRGLTATKPSTSLSVSLVSSVPPGAAKPSMRAARCTVCPMAVYSM